MKIKSKVKPQSRTSSLRGRSQKLKVKYYQAVGRRKEVTARVRLYPLVKNKEVRIGDHKLKKGELLVNRRPAHEYFPGEANKVYYLEPLKMTNALNRFAVTIKVTGGGKSGQLAAVVHGLSRALEKVDKEKFRPILKKKGLLTRDARVKERRKAGLAQKARARKQSPKR